MTLAYRNYSVEKQFFAKRLYMISKKLKYALKAMEELTLAYGKGQVLTQEIATNRSVPKKFLERILIDLRNGGLVKSKRGKDGGYQLARPPVEITIGEIMRIIDGPIALSTCVSATAFAECLECADRSACKTRAVLHLIREETSLILDSMNFVSYMSLQPVIPISET